MPEIILRFETIKKKGADFDVPVPVSVKFGDKDVEQFKFNNPLTDKDLAETRWYLEQYWYWPSDIDQERARKVEGKLPEWGKALFDAVFQKASDAMRLFSDFDKADGERVLTIDTNEPRILRLPWELLRDEGGYLFSKKPPVSIRRHMHKTAGKPIQPFDLPARILMVTCRPDGAGFIDPRSIATPLLDSLDAIPEQVEVEFLRPPTLRALDDRLRDLNQPRVHIVHFDGHGVYDKGIGLGFLLFEDEKHEKHLVDAEQLGTLLNESGIPLMVLNACQSAQPDDRNPFASVASRLIESGVGGVVAMNYSVLVETAKRFTKEFYGALARGQSANAAMDTARRDLFRDTKRLTLRRPNQEDAIVVHLQDWFLPALYQQAETLTPFAPSSPALPPQGKGAPSPTGRGQGEGIRGKFPPPPLHGFHGRARELLDLERAFATRNIVVLHGFGGQGKTSLATQAAEWFTRTRLFDRAAFISFETGASLDFVLNELGNALVEENFQIHEGDKIEAIAQSLKEKPALVVFDNFESVLPNGNAPMPELQDLLNAAAKWFSDDGRRTMDNRQSSIVNGHSRLLITTRNTDIPHPAFTPSNNCIHKELEGLAPSDALELAASILEAYSLPRPPRLPLEELLAFLKGHPLSLQLALPQLRDYSAGQLVEQYQSILPQMKKGAAKERNESLEVSLRFSLDRLGEEAKALLARLVVFEGGAMERIMLAITEIPETEWNAIKPQLVSTALIRIEELDGVTIPFIHFHPTLIPYLRASSPFPELGEGAGGEGTEPDIHNTAYRYWRGYYEYANQLYQDDTQHPIQARSIVLRELPNLKCALKRTLAAGALDEAVTFAECINRFLDNFGRWRERDEIAAEVERAVNSAQSSVSNDGKITKAQFTMESGRGERLLQQGRAGEAEKVFRALLARLEGEAEYDTRYDQTLVLGYLGRCLHAQGRTSQASDYYRRAIVLSEKLEQTENVKRQTAAYHVDLADTLRVSGQYVNAREEYEIGLKIVTEIDDKRSIGVVIELLGTLALQLSDLKDAKTRYLTALSLYQQIGEDRAAAIAWHQLGRVAQEARDWDEAERCYKQSLTIKESLGDWALAATSCNQLAIVAESAGRPQEAERWYLRTLEIEEKLGNPKNIASDYNNLAGLYLFQNRLDEAETYARRALAIMETLDLSSEPWKTYNILAEIAEKRGRMDEVREWRRKEQESFAAFAGSDTQIKEWLPLIGAIVAACNGNQEAQAGVAEFLKQNSEGWPTTVTAIQKILDGERDFESLTGGMQSRTGVLVVQRILQALAGQTTDDRPQTTENGQSSVGTGQPSSDQQQGVTLPQLLDLVERAAGGERELGAQLAPMVEQMSKDFNVPPEIRTLGLTLREILYGGRNPSLDGLPDELASAVRGLLGRLKNK